MSVGQFFMIGALSYALATLGWRQVFLWAGGAHFVLLPLLFWAIPGGDKSGPRAGAGQAGLTMKEAMRTRRFWILTIVYAICGFDDFFVTTHVVAFALDSGLKPAIAGNLLAIMGVTGLIGVLASG